MTAGYSAYQRTQIATADRRRIIVLLYEGAITRLEQAKDAVRRGDADRRVISVNKALDIIHLLRSGLDFESGGDIALNLQRLYDYVRDIVAEGNISGETEKLDEAIHLLSMLLVAWRAISMTGAGAETPLLEQRTREIADSVASTG
jgi:flagellar protein FliS